MPTKHIPDAIWRRVEKEIVKAVIATQRPIKESEILEVLLKKGLENITNADYKTMKDKPEV
ncbi:MAG TPA: hypothetical protein VF602_03000 [Pedobacter sp.]|jgi:hypothetical protein